MIGSGRPEPPRASRAAALVIRLSFRRWVNRWTSGGWRTAQAVGPATDARRRAIAGERKVGLVVLVIVGAAMFGFQVMSQMTAIPGRVTAEDGSSIGPIAARCIKWADMRRLLPADAFRVDLAPEDARWLALAIVVSAPLFEEVIFRGFLYRSLRRNWPWWAAALASGGAFAACHPPAAVAPVLVLGLLAAVLVEWSGSLVAPVLLHATYNAVVVSGLWHRSSLDRLMSDGAKVAVRLAARALTPPQLAHRLGRDRARPHGHALPALRLEDHPEHGAPSALGGARRPSAPRTTQDRRAIGVAVDAPIAPPAMLAGWTTMEDVRLLGWPESNGTSAVERRACGSLAVGCRPSPPRY